MACNELYDTFTCRVFSWIRIENSAKTLVTLICLFHSVFCSESVRTCQPIRSTMCRGLGYNFTGMPNLVDHPDQDDAILQLQTFTPLIQYNCSSRLKFFLCSVYVPMCTEKVMSPIGPCKPLCESVRDRCQPVLREFGYPWPGALNCSKFPEENNHKTMCMEGPNGERDKHSLSPARRPSHPDHTTDSFPTSVDQEHFSETKFPDFPKHNTKPCMQLGYRNFIKYTYVNRTDRCALLCGQNDVFTDDNKYFANIWMSVWAGLCFLSTLFTVLTFMIDRHRFHYPERSIILMALCYNISSIAYIVRLIAGRNNIACNTESQSGLSILTQEGLENTECAAVFLMLYFFGTASSVWWVILAFTWFLAVGRKWSHEAIQVHCNYYHLIAWTIPAIQTIVILVMRVVDADELNGVCYVGNQDASTLMGFVIAPLLFYLALGSFFLVVGFVSLFSSLETSCRTSYRNNSGNSASVGVTAGRENRIEALMVRIGIFSVLYTIPAVCVIGCLLYEFNSRAEWYFVGSEALPNTEIFMLRLFMSLVVGITSGMWAWSAQTVGSWKNQFKKVFSPKRDRKGIIYAVPVRHYHQVPAKVDKTSSSSSSKAIRTDKYKQRKSNSETIV